MVESVLWFERKFSFDMPPWMFPNIVERLRGTPARLEELLRGVPSEILVKRDGERWSIQENAGHLLDLESLWAGRIEDFMSGVKTLRAAELKNMKTHQAEHNQRKIEDILQKFRRERSAWVSVLENLEEPHVELTSLHPRLQQPMRLLDACFFTAEHDDHHLARVSELKRKFLD